MFFNTLIGCIIFLITNISLLYTSHLFVRRFLPNTPASVRLVAIGTLFYAFIILIFQALSPFHAITKTWVTITCLLLALGSHLVWGKQRDLKADIEPINVWVRDGLSSRWAVLLIICGFVVLLSLSRALLMPPLAWDCLTYHLTSAALWIQKGTLLIFSAPDQIQYAHFPINGEIFASWLLLPFHNDLLVNTMNFPITLLGGISCYAIARELGLTRKEASFVPVLICFAPVIYVQITTEYVDNAAFAFCSTSILFALRYLKEGYLHDYLLALVASGIMLGIKFTGIPVTGLILIATTIKTINLARHPGFLKKLSLIFLGLLILCALGGRQYLRNTIDARNPLYPLPVRIMNHEIAEGWSGLDKMNDWISQYELRAGLDKLGWWERTYRKFCYLSLAAGPKYFLFLILAVVSLFARPRHIPKHYWYFLSMMWIIPIIIYYTGHSMDFAKKGYYLDRSTRFLSPYITLFTIQGLVLLQTHFKQSKYIKFVLTAFVAWDLLYINKTHLLEVASLYPVIVLIITVGIILYSLLYERLGLVFTRERTSSFFSTLTDLVSRRSKKCLSYTIGVTILVIGLYFLQTYRDATRYKYYHGYSDHSPIPRTTVNGWEFLDNPDDRKTIALAMNWVAPGHYWFFYPLLGRHLQNNVVYISAKHKWGVPTWLHMGQLRGNDFSIWLHNLKRGKVDYVLVRTPWPVELQWMVRHEDKFRLMFSDENCKIFKYTREAT
jgi:hypothetical protein